MLDQEHEMLHYYVSLCICQDGPEMITKIKIESMIKTCRNDFLISSSNASQLNYKTS